MQWNNKKYANSIDKKITLGYLKHIYWTWKKQGKYSEMPKNENKKRKQIRKRASYCTRGICFLIGISGQTTGRKCYGK